MKQRTTLSLTALLLCGAFATPVAFAQSQDSASATQATQATTSATPPTTQSGTDTAASGTAQATTQADAATATDPASAAMGGAPASAKATNWSDLDTDHNGSLSKTEAGALDSLSNVFDSADANKDGTLTADEYRAYLKTQGK